MHEMETTRHINLQRKPLKDFVPGADTLYVSKMESGFQRIYYCKFTELRRGIVVAEVIERPDFGNVKPGEELTARASKCLLWGKSGRDEWNRCHWFKNTSDPVD